MRENAWDFPITEIFPSDVIEEDKINFRRGRRKKVEKLPASQSGSRGGSSPVDVKKLVKMLGRGLTQTQRTVVVAYTAGMIPEEIALMYFRAHGERVSVECVELSYAVAVEILREEAAVSQFSGRIFCRRK